MTKAKSYFLCGIGGSGMLPLATILRAQGASVAGSDRALDQGRSQAKFDWLTEQGIALFPQDGSGLSDGDQVLVASAAIEDSVSDVAAALALGCRRVTRAELLAELFNAAPDSLAVGGTSGKSTVTGMAGWILAETGRDPTIMNGAVMKNFARADQPFASSRTGQSGMFVSEVDESDGSIAMFRPRVAVLNNVSLDHKSMEELHQLFGDFLSVAKHAIWNADDPESRKLLNSLDLSHAVSFGLESGADFSATDIHEAPLSSNFTLSFGGSFYPVTLRVPGRHNIANALAAIAAATMFGVHIADAVMAIEAYTGLGRRFELVGRTGEGRDAISVIDDFGHNPDKVAATLATLKAFPGRVIAFFQPHGFGPIKVMGAELAETFAKGLGPDDHVLICDPAYFGGTVDRSMGSEFLVDAINAAAPGGVKAEHIADRAECGNRIVELARPGDRIIVMGARDDTLSQFARDILARLG